MQPLPIALLLFFLFSILTNPVANAHPAYPDAHKQRLVERRLGVTYEVSEYGDRNQLPMFRNLLMQSPYHNLQRRAYPDTLVMTADADDRVVPAHSYKYAARLQELQRGDGIALLHIKKMGSHSAASGPAESVAKYVATRWAFLLQALR